MAVNWSVQRTRLTQAVRHRHRVGVDRLPARRLATLVATVAVAVAIGHVLFANAVEDVPLGRAIAGTPAYLADTFLRGELGETPGGGCNPSEFIALCAHWGRQGIDDMLRDRVPVDLQLIVGGMLLGTLLGIAGGRGCGAYPRTFAARVLRGATAVVLSCPPYFLGFVFLMWFS